MEQVNCSRLILSDSLETLGSQRSLAIEKRIAGQQGDEHLVEAANQGSELVLARLDLANGEILALLDALGRLGQPDDVASAMAWFLHPDQHWVTGQVLGVDGGLADLGARPGR